MRALGLWLALVLVGCGGSSATPGSDGPDGDDAGVDAPGVDAPGVDAGPVTVTATGFSVGVQQDLVYVAGQDGDGAWQRLIGGGGAYTLTVASGRYALVAVCPDGYGSTSLTIWHYAVDETTTPSLVCDGSAPWTTVTGTVTGLGASQTARLGFGRVSGALTGATYSRPVPPGTWDPILSRDDGTTTDRMIIHRNAYVGTTPSVLDFDFGTEGFAPTSRALTVTGAGAGETVHSGAGFRTRQGDSAPYIAPTGTALFIPVAQLEAGDMHVVYAGATDVAAGTTRAVEHYHHAAADAVIVLPPVFAAAASVPTTSPQVQLRAAFQSATEATAYAFRFSQYDASTGVGVSWGAVMTAGWLGPAGAQTYTFPDLSALAGWDATWSPYDGITADYQVTEMRASTGFAGWVAARGPRPGYAVPADADGLQFSYATKSGSILP